MFMCMFSPTGHKAHSPEARVQRHLHLHALVLLQDDALHHDQPVVSGHGHPYQQQPAGSKHCGQDGQSAAAARTHLQDGEVCVWGVWGKGWGRAKGCQTGRGSREVATLSKLVVEAKKNSSGGGREVIGVR